MRSAHHLNCIAFFVSARLKNSGAISSAKRTAGVMTLSIVINALKPAGGNETISAA
jgi:hypothetical protein